MHQQRRNWQEKINKQFNDWGIIRQIYLYDIDMHSYIFRSIDVILQLDINSGGHIFDYGYCDHPCDA